MFEPLFNSYDSMLHMTDISPRKTSLYKKSSIFSGTKIMGQNEAHYPNGNKLNFFRPCVKKHIYKIANIRFLLKLQMKR